MTGPASLAPTIRLMTWLSPAFPLGAFAYSHGLETLFETADLTNRASFEDWLTDMISEGTGWSDAVLCAQAWATAPEDAAALSDLASLAESLCATAERHEETL
ncbi:MAG: urease accessory UreF family protein, partial [Pseudomonadota bacterium]